jgi:predicted transcriptional regulator
MNKIYQPIVIEKANDIIESLSDFFFDYEIESLDFAKEYMYDKLTEKFIAGELEEDEVGNILLFTKSEFEIVLKEIIAGSILYELKDKGLVESYEDSTTEETFFLTKKGKKLLKEDITKELNDLD